MKFCPANIYYLRKNFFIKFKIKKIKKSREKRLMKLKKKITKKKSQK